MRTIKHKFFENQLLNLENENVVLDMGSTSFNPKKNQLPN
jgi:hypothetical protein